MDGELNLQLLVKCLNEERGRQFQVTARPDLEQKSNSPKRPDCILEAAGYPRKIAVEQTSAPLINEATKFNAGWADVANGLVRTLRGALPGYFILWLPPRIEFSKKEKNRLVEILKSEIINKSSELCISGETVKCRLGLEGRSPLPLELKKVGDNPSGIAVFPLTFDWYPTVEPEGLAEILRKSFLHANSKFDHPDTDFGDWSAYERLLFIDRLPIEILSENLDQCQEAVDLLVHEGEAERIDSVYVMRNWQVKRAY